MISFITVFTRLLQEGRRKTSTGGRLLGNNARDTATTTDTGQLHQHHQHQHQHQHHHQHHHRPKRQRRQDGTLESQNVTTIDSIEYYDDDDNDDDEEEEQEEVRQDYDNNPEVDPINGGGRSNNHNDNNSHGDDGDDDNDEILLQVEAGSNLVLVSGAYVELITAEVTSKEVYEGVVVISDDDNEDSENINDDDNYDNGNADEATEATYFSRRISCCGKSFPLYYWIMFGSVILAVSLIVLLMIMLLIVRPFQQQEQQTLNKLDDSTFQPSVPERTNVTINPTLYPSQAPTSQHLTDLIDYLQHHLMDPNAKMSLSDTTSPQYQAARWMAEVDQYIPTNDNDMIQRYVVVVLVLSTKQEGPLPQQDVPSSSSSSSNGVPQDFVTIPAWINSCGMLNPRTHVCDWHCDWPKTSRFLQDLIVNQPNKDHMGIYCPELSIPPPQPSSSSTNETTTTTTNITMTMTKMNDENDEGDDDGNDGVFRMVPAQTITSIQIVGNELQGTIPTAELALLTNLQTLNLSANRLYGTLWLGHLPSSLERIHVVANSLSINLQGMGRLHHLQDLFTSLKELTDVHTRDLPYNSHILDNLPSDLEDLTNLSKLYMENMGLTGSLPTALGRFTNLLDLSLSHNDLSGFVPSEFSRLTGLQNLRLDSNPNLKGSLQGLCENIDDTATKDEDDNNVTIPTVVEVDYAPLVIWADCLSTNNISCSCCTVCCHPQGECQEMMP